MLDNRTFASDVQFGSRIGQEVRVMRGDKEIYTGKWRAGFHQRLTSLAFKEGENISVLRSRDDRLIFRVQPNAIWEEPKDD